MQALRWHGREDLRIDDVEAPRIEAADDVIVAPRLVGLCGTDLHEYRHGPNMIRDTSPHPLTGKLPPVTLGHEFSGVVTELGAEVTDLAVGQRVAIDPCIRCGACQWCASGQYHICARGGSIGLAADGALADRVRVKRYNVVPVPDDVSDLMAALAEPMAVGLHATSRGRVRPGDNVLVLGAGPIGLAVVMCALQAGAAAVMVSEPAPARRELAGAMGATHAFDPGAEDVRRAAFVATGRIGPDVVIEATGRADQFELAVNSVRRGGSVVLVGVGDVDLSVNLRSVVLSERSIHGSLGYNFDIPRVLGLMSQGRLNPSALVTDTIPFQDAVSAFATLADQSANQLKVLISI